MARKPQPPQAGAAGNCSAAGDPSAEWLKRRAAEDKLFATTDDQALWAVLKGLAARGKFVRQYVVAPYIADFACPSRRLIVELSGKYHFRGEQPADEAERRAALNAMGYTVVTVGPEEVAAHPRRVARQINDIIRNMEISYPKQPKQAPAQPTAATAAAATPASHTPLPLPSEVTPNAWAVDAACSGNPGPMEYQGIDLATGQQVFHYGPVHGTNNIGEFLAIVHALALWDKQGITGKTLYSDSYNAILWVKKKQCRTKLERNANTEPLYQVIARAEQWLRTHPLRVPIVQWDTRRWGDIPADFGRK